MGLAVLGVGVGLDLAERRAGYHLRGPFIRVNPQLVGAHALGLDEHVVNVGGNALAELRGGRSCEKVLESLRGGARGAVVLVDPLIAVVGERNLGG